MRHRRRLKGAILLILMILISLVLPGPGRGAEFEVRDCRFHAGVRLAYGQHHKSPPVRLYSLLPYWGISLIPLHSGLLPGRMGLSFEVEGIISVAEAESTGWEVGVTPLLKLTLPLGPGLHLFLEGGAGLIGELFDSPAVPQAFNFTPQGGLGVEAALAPRLGVSAAYRFRHSSNAGIYKENPAFNVHFGQIGIIYYF